MSGVIYLVEGYWHDYDSEDHWFPAAFTSHEPAEQYRQECQAWVDRYVHEFWEEFVRRFGEPRARDSHCIFTTETVEQIQDNDHHNPGYDLAQEWFGYQYLFDDQDAAVLDAEGNHAVDLADFGRNRMRRLGPDPLIDMSFVPGGKCHYRVVVVRSL